MRTIDTIMIHCSDTPPSMDIGAEEIDQWHRERGFDCIGYHFVLQRNGLWEIGRPLEQVGAHCVGYNDTSIGICMVGGRSEVGEEAESNFTLDQYLIIVSKIVGLSFRFPEARVLGHNDVTDLKECPSFNVQRLFARHLPRSGPLEQ